MIRLSKAAALIARRLIPALFVGAAFVSVANAQGTGAVVPPLHSSVDANGVDMMTGEFSTSSPTVSIGGPQNGLAYAELMLGNGYRRAPIASLNYTASVYSVTVGSSTEFFSTSLVSLQNSGSTLTYNGTTNVFTYTMRDGTVVEFDEDYVGTYSQYYANRAVVTSIERPGGARTEYHYYTNSFTYVGDGGFPVIDIDLHRLQSISNSFGYQLHLEHERATASDLSHIFDFFEVVEVTALNNTVERCAPSNNSCTPSNSWPTLEINRSGTTITYTDPLGRDTVFTWSSGGEGLDRINYPGGVATDIDISYDVNDRVSSISDGGSNTWSYTYTKTADTFETDVNGPGSDDYTFLAEYDPVTDDLAKTTFTDQANEDWVNEYDAYGRVTKVIAPLGNYVTYTYDARSNLTAVAVFPTSAGTGIQSTASFPASCTNQAICNQPTSTTDAAGATTNYYYNANGTLNYVLAPAASGGAIRARTDFYYDDQAGYFYDPVTGTAGHGDVVSMPHYTRQCATNIPSSCAAASRTISEVLYQPSNGSNFSNILPVTIVSCSHNDTNDGNTSGSYPMAKQCGTSASVRSASQLTWNRFSLLETVDGPLSGSADTARYYYDSVGQRLEGMVGPDPDGTGGNLRRAVVYEYHSTTGQPTRFERGRISSQPASAPSAWTGYTAHDAVETDYDALYRPVEQRQISIASGTTETIEAVMQTSYTALSQVLCVAVRMNPSEFNALPTSACSLDTAGSYGSDRITRYTYRSTGQVASVTSGYNVSPITVDYVYWDDGLLARVDDGQDRQTTYTYDSYRRLQGVFHSYATGANEGTVNSGDVMIIGYDSAGRRNSILNRDGTGVVYTFDSLSRIIHVALSASAYDIDIEYDLFGRVTEREVRTYNGWGEIHEASYDPLSRVTEAGYRHGGTAYFVDYVYDSAGRRTRMNWDGTSNYITYEYNTVGALTSIVQNASATHFVDYSYDNHGRLTDIERLNGVDTTYTYDNASRLTSLSHDISGTADDITFNYTWNPAGQIVTRRMDNSLYRYSQRSAGTINYDINGLNQIDYILSGDNFTYDADGNLTDIGATDDYSYDDRHRLTETPAGTDLTYGADGNLDTLTTARQFSYDGTNITIERNAGDAIAYRFVHTGGMGAPALRLSGTGNTTQEFYLTDERGSVIAATNTSGGRAYINAYDEYGVEDTGNQGLYGYTGQVRLGDNSLTHNRNRAYHGGIGRFLQTDPIGQAGGINLYAYVGGDPINFVDPWGLRRRCTTRNDGEILEEKPCPMSQSEKDWLRRVFGWLWGDRLSENPGQDVIDNFASLAGLANGIQDCAEAARVIEMGGINSSGRSSNGATVVNAELQGGLGISVNVSTGAFAADNGVWGFVNSFSIGGGAGYGGSLNVERANQIPTSGRIMEASFGGGAGPAFWAPGPGFEIAGTAGEGGYRSGGVGGNFGSLISFHGGGGVGTVVACGGG